jgi:hypothetical protein
MHVAGRGISLFAVAWLVGRDVAAARVSARADQERQRTLRKGDRIELVLPRLGIPTRGTVCYVDDLQILVKWDDGRSENLRPSFADRFRIIEGRANDSDEGRELGRQRGGRADAVNHVGPRPREAIGER